MPPNPSISNLGQREASTVSGTTVKRLFGSSGASGNSAQRSGIQVCNHDATLSIFVKLVAANASLPSISAADHDYKIPPGDTIRIPARPSVDACVLNGSNAAATASYTALEVK